MQTREKSPNMQYNEARKYLRRRINPNEDFENLLRFPKYLEIETVNACNARCPMCTIEEWSRKSPAMKDGLYKKIADELIQNRDQLKRVSLYRDGEPLLDKKLASRVAVLKDGGIPEVAISTNVSLLDEKRASDLLDAGLDTILLSIDSLDKEVFESIRVKLVFEEVLENALRFIELRNRIRPQTKIWVRMIRQQSNFDEWPAFETFWREKLSPHDRVNFSNIHNWGEQLKGFQPVAKSFEPNLPCIALWSLMIIFANGDVPLCNVDFNNRFPTGSVAEDSIATVWNSKIMNQRRDLHLQGDKGRISICENCNVWDEPPDIDNVAPEFAQEVSVAPR